MNRKFNHPTEEYYPPATAPDHFSHLPDALIPDNYHKPEADPLEKDTADSIRESKTPPPTPPELEPGRARCRIFHEVKHYVDPCYQNPDFQRKFTSRLILGSVILNVPTIIVLMYLAIQELDYVVVKNPVTLIVIFLLSSSGCAVYIYFAGLFRTYPGIYIALGVRVILATVFLTSFMLLVHAAFLNGIEHPDNEGAEHNLTSGGHLNYEIGRTRKLDHAPPYLGILYMLLTGTVKGIICILLLKYKYSVDNYMIPFVIYTTCFSVSALLVTIVLNNGFQHEFNGYDLFQVIVGCFAASTALMRTPIFIDRLFEGRICPLREGEFMYALVHYGV